ncbi:MAG: LytTR family DNA-binding domain-containing protein [Bacteroidales bacterium]|jgi:DNA-binding LytR/AlgR family response regulator|nr:LytTR family DNA-binding domain-containing protein [Bacteroidales bacterium]
MNCIIIDDDQLSRKIIESFVERTDFLKLTHSFSNAIEALNSVTNEEKIDLIFLDIEMPEMTGIDFLNSFKSTPQVIIVSAQEKYALDAFEYDVTDYLLKPVTYGRFFKAAEKAFKRLGKVESDNKKEIFIKKNSALVRLSYEEILWVEALENYVVINTFDEKYTIHFTMKSIEKQLPLNMFKRIHRSFIVNISKINSIEDNSVVINHKTGRKVLPIGKSYRDNLLGDLNLMNR